MSYASLRRLRPGTSPRLLCVDDEPVILQLLTRILEQNGFSVATVPNAAEAIRAYDGAHFDLVVTDIHMPGGDGLGLVRSLRERDPGLPIVVISGHGTAETAIKALREGATGMLIKPFTADELLGEVARTLAAADLHREALQYRLLCPVLDSIALTLSTAIEARHLETGEHCRQLGVLAERMARVLGLDQHQRMAARIGGYLHDIGKIGIADAILLKPGPLSDREMAEMRRHSEIGASILGVHETLDEIDAIVRHHHERWDGLGYPGGLGGASIPIGARVIAVADAFSAMTSDRVYRRALPVERAWAELRAHAGTQFDPQLVDVFGEVVDEEGRLRRLDPAIERDIRDPLPAPHLPDLRGGRGAWRLYQAGDGAPAEAVAEPSPDTLAAEDSAQAASREEGETMPGARDVLVMETAVQLD